MSFYNKPSLYVQLILYCTETFHLRIETLETSIYHASLWHQGVCMTQRLTLGPGEEGRSFILTYAWHVQPAGYMLDTSPVIGVCVQHEMPV